MPRRDRSDTAADWLALHALTLGYGGHTVVEGLELSLARGGVACLLGASGCGKTTVLRAIAGFEPVRAGSIVLGGRVIASPTTHVAPESRRVGMVFQDHALFPHLSVARNVAFGLRGRSDVDARVQHMLETVGLAGAGDSYPHELSGGQQQRVALARALAPAPALLLLDEPLSSLDVELRERLGGELRRMLRDEGMTALLVTHDQHEAFAIADAVGVMADGRIVQWDTAYNLYHRPRTRYVADFVGEGAFVPGRVLGPHEIDTELGRMRGAGPIRLDDARGAVGEIVDVLLRPDDIVHDDDAAQQARVVAKAFRGAEFLYTLALPSGRTVLALVPSHHAHAIGSDIGIRLAVEHLVAFRRPLAR